MRKRVPACILILMLILCSCAPLNTGDLSVTADSSLTQATDTFAENSQPPAEPAKEEKLLSQMTQREKVAQLFIVAPEALAMTQPDGTEAAVTDMNELLENGLKEYPVGGVVLFAGNIVSPTQISALNDGLQMASGLGMFIAVDEEGGRVARIANNAAFSVKRYKNAASVGAAGKAEDGFEMGSTIGAYLREYGFNLDFAPVGDVFTNPNNTVIGNRAFSTDAATAAILAEAAANGLKGQGIIPTYKHFPGHGDTAQDSHSQLAVVDKTAAEMESCEWLPFMKATDEDMVMVGHIACSNITGDHFPATLSHTMVTQHLRGSCGFNGLVITDAMNMKAITDTYGAGNAAVMAIQAGCDIVLMPEDLETAFDAVMEAVDNGRISMERLNESVRRILQYKIEYGLIQ